MVESITSRLYSNDAYLNYLRYNPKWYKVLDKNPAMFSEFEKEVKVALKMTLSDKINNFKKQIDFVNGLIKYLNNN
ncbi:MAG: hypothetical protein IJX78_04385 [Bacilli bacterium]|nr:hypothetical protein [Bacilli bacterium]